MKARSVRKRLLLLCALSSLPFSQVQLSAATYEWGNLTPNGNLITTNGYALAAASNWVGGATPTFDNQAELVFTNLNSGTNTTIYGGSATTVLNRITVDTTSTLRFNSANSTFSFQGTNAPTIDVLNGTLRLEVRIANAVGLTKTGPGTLFANLQSVTSGFTGNFIVEEGLVAAGNNFALGDAKTVEILTGAAVDMNGQRWGSSVITGGSVVARNYTFNISGTGIGGTGALLNSSVLDVPDYTTPGLSGIYILNLDTNASVGGAGNFGIATGSGGTLNGNGYTLTKVGSNEVWVGGNATNIAYQVDGGTLVGFQVDGAFGNAAGSVSVAGGATLASSGPRNFSNSITLADGATLNNFGNTATWSGNATLSGGQAVVTATTNTANTTISGSISGPGGITKQSANTLTLAGTNTYTGGTLVSAGVLRGSSASLQGSITNNASVVFDQTTAGTYSGAMSGGGKVEKTGGGTLTVTGPNTYTGGTLVSAGVLRGSSASLQGSVTNNASVVFDQTTAGTYSGAMSGGGTVEKAGGGVLTLAGTNTYLGGTAVQAGALVVNGVLSNSAVTVTNGATLAGSGTVRALTILDGATLSPGNSPGTLNVLSNTVWNPGANYNWQLYDTALGAGTGWDLLNVGGSLNLTALSVGNEFNINLWSLSGIAPDANGNALNFDSTQTYTWTILTAASGITGFSADKFNINLGANNGTAGFANALGGGTFSLLTAGNNLNLVFTPAGGPSAVPEPGTWAAAALLAGCAAFARWRKRRACGENPGNEKTEAAAAS